MKPSNSDSYYACHRLEILAKAKKQRELNPQKCDPVKNREAVKRWRDSHLEVARKRNRVEFKKWRESNRIEYRAIKLAQAVVILGSSCEFCGDSTNLRRFLPDFNYPHVVVTVCRECRSWIKRGEIKKQ